MNRCAPEELEQLKKRIGDNVSVNDSVVCGLCDELILAASAKEDWHSVAFGHIWRADYFFYVASDLMSFMRELDLAQTYIDERAPSALLEKYYTLKHVLYENIYDTQSAFRFVLKALDVAEKLGLYHRIGANYGNIGAYYMDICYYEEALLYTGKALSTLQEQAETTPRIIRLLLANLVVINLKLGRYSMAKQALRELSELPLAEKDLKIYIDYGYLLYYSEVLDLENSLARLKALFEDGVLDTPRAFAFEILCKALEAMIRLDQKENAEKLLNLLTGMLEDSEPDAQLSLCKLRIACAERFGPPELLQSCLCKYYTYYMAAQEKANVRKAEGLHAKVELNELYLKNHRSQEELSLLSELANYDDLTQVYNRRYLNIRQDEILNSQQTPYMGFALVDIDYFKEYNDYYGHLAGDELLRMVAACLKECTAEHMAVFRYGGDEFVCLAEHATQEELAAYVKRVQAALRERNIEHLHSRCSDRVTLSIGYGSRAVTGKIDLLALFETVDSALYDAKRDGRNGARSIPAIHVPKEEL